MAGCHTSQTARNPSSLAPLPLSLPCLSRAPACSIEIPRVCTHPETAPGDARDPARGRIGPTAARPSILCSGLPHSRHGKICALNPKPKPPHGPCASAPLLAALTVLMLLCVPFSLPSARALSGVLAAVLMASLPIRLSLCCVQALPLPALLLSLLPFSPKMPLRRLEISKIQAGV
jgi:hypothetical protein